MRHTFQDIKQALALLMISVIMFWIVRRWTKKREPSRNDGLHILEHVVNRIGEVSSQTSGRMTCIARAHGTNTYGSVTRPRSPTKWSVVHMLLNSRCNASLDANILLCFFMLSSATQHIRRIGLFSVEYGELQVEDPVSYDITLSEQRHRHMYCEIQGL